MLRLSLAPNAVSFSEKDKLRRVGEGEGELASPFLENDEDEDEGKDEERNATQHKEGRMNDQREKRNEIKSTAPWAWVDEMMIRIENTSAPAHRKHASKTDTRLAWPPRSLARRVPLCLFKFHPSILFPSGFPGDNRAYGAQGHTWAGKLVPALPPWQSSFSAQDRGRAVEAVVGAWKDVQRPYEKGEAEQGRRGGR